MSSVINGVPRELLEFLCSNNNNALSRLPELRALLSEQPKAGDGWPKLERQAKVGAGVFAAGVSARLVVEAAYRQNEYANDPPYTPEQVQALRSAFGEQPPARRDQGDEVRRLREALEPFAALAPLFDDGARGGTMPETGAIAAWPRLGANRELIENELTVEHLRAARAALTHSQQGAKE